MGLKIENWYAVMLNDYFTLFGFINGQERQFPIIDVTAENKTLFVQSIGCKIELGEVNKLWVTDFLSR